MTHTDRALTWDEWRVAVFDATRDRVIAITLDVDEAQVYPAAYVTLTGWIADLKEAVTAGDLVLVERIFDRIRAKLTIERAWEQERSA